MSYAAVVNGERFAFADLRELLAKANERRSGDEAAGLAAATERERAAAKAALADTRVSDFHDQPLIDDEITRVTREGVVAEARAGIGSLTVGQLRELILRPEFPGRWRSTLAGGFLPEVAAAVAKLMTDRDLVRAAKPLRTVTRCRNTLGELGTLGARIEPRHPGDDVVSILSAVVDGLGYACGDAVIRLSPATSSVPKTVQLLAAINEFTATLEIPTQACVLSHATTQLRALDAGAPVDLLFQSLAGTEDANRSAGVSMALLREAREAVLTAQRARPADFVGQQCVYIETGQGGALPPASRHGIDQLTLEARAQGAAKTLDPFLVNSVVRFGRPPDQADASQLTRAGLEDHFCGKLQGLPMGVDVSYAGQAEVDRDGDRGLLALLARAGSNYLTGLPGDVDPTLGRQAARYHDIASTRRQSSTGPAPEFARWAESVGILVNGEISDSWGEPGAARTARLARLAEIIADRHVPSVPKPALNPAR